MNPLDRINKRIELLEDAIVVYRYYIGGIEVIPQEDVEKELRELKKERDQMISNKQIIKFKYFNGIDL